MIDLHCHILPGVDDGAKDMEESIAMARNAVAEGITHILATPHHKAHGWSNEKEEVQRLVSELQERIDAESIDLTIFPGQEVRLYGEIIQDIEANKIQFIDEENQYLLIEFPSTTVPAYAERLFYELQAIGVTPIVVHPERNQMIKKQPELLKNLVDKGALAQLTAGSYVGKYGAEAEKLSKRLIEANLIHYIASDAHNTTNRQFYLKETYVTLEKDYGQELVKQFQQTIKDLVNGDLVFPPQTKKIKKQRFFGLF